MDTIRAKSLVKPRSVIQHIHIGEDILLGWHSHPFKENETENVVQHATVGENFHVAEKLDCVSRSANQSSLSQSRAKAQWGILETSGQHFLDCVTFFSSQRHFLYHGLEPIVKHIQAYPPFLQIASGPEGRKAAWTKDKKN